MSSSSAASIGARKVPMRVLALGQSRTGTHSLSLALQQLGYVKCYHMGNIWEEAEHGKLWSAALEAKFEGSGKPFEREDWDKLLGQYQAVTDQPCAVFAEELLAAYPDTKVILTVRESQEEWVASQKRLIAVWNKYWPKSPIIKYLGMIFDRPRKGLEGAARALYLVHKYADDVNTQEVSYTGHNEKFRQLCAGTGREFLEFHVKEGWKPLCTFLGDDHPTEPFPHSHSATEEETAVRENVERRVARIVSRSTAAVGILTVVLVGTFAVFRNRRSWIL